MVFSVLAAWWVGSRNARRRQFGFYTFLASNGLWVVWGVYAQAWAVVMLQFGLAAINIRGAGNNDAGQQNGDAVDDAHGGAKNDV